MEDTQYLLPLDIAHEVRMSHEEFANLTAATKIYYFRLVHSKYVLIDIY